MNSVKCPKCNLTNWAVDPTCKRCGQPLPNASASAAEGGYAENTSYSNSNFSGHKAKTGMAITSMVMGIVSVVGGCLGGFLLAPIGLILGIVSLVRANRRPSEYGGMGFAVAGTVLSGFGVLCMPIILAIAIPNLLAARRAANEGAAISSIRTLASAENTYMTVSGTGSCGDLVTLHSKGLIDPVLGTGQKSGYRFMIVTMGGPSPICEIHATPMSSSAGSRSFYLSTEDNVIRTAQKDGQSASRNDPPIASYRQDDR